MNLGGHATSHAIAAMFCLQVTTPAAADLSCAPKGTPATFPVETDTFFNQALKIWGPRTQSRYIEGTPGKSCEAVTAIGYEGFPTWHCTYSSADRGAGHYAPLKAEVIVLEPSAKELARWTVHACRVNSATDKTMGACLASLINAMINSNGAQYPVVGSVVESPCDWKKHTPPCVRPSDAQAIPDNTWFRDGVSIDYATLADWDNKTYNYTAIFDTAKSDKDIKNWYYVSRVSSARSAAWISWRQHIGKPVIPDGVEPKGFDISRAGSLAVSRAVHKKACSSDSNELMDALVYTSGFVKK